MAMLGVRRTASRQRWLRVSYTKAFVLIRRVARHITVFCAPALKQQQQWQEDGGEEEVDVEEAEVAVVPVGQKMMTPMLKCRLPWVRGATSIQVSPKCTDQLQTLIRTVAGQNSNAGMLPPSDSDEDSEEEAVAVKAKAAQVRIYTTSSP